jgi:hypothetical protein
MNRDAAAPDHPDGFDAADVSRKTAPLEVRFIEAERCTSPFSA